MTWERVQKELLRLSPDYNSIEIRAFKSAFYELKKIKPTLDAESYINVYKHDYWAYYSKSQYEEDWIELFGIPWDVCLGMRVIKEKGKQLSHAEIIASCLWTMTYLGFSEASVKKMLKRFE
jgi:hypothetical protein